MLVDVVLKVFLGNKEVFSGVVSPEEKTFIGVGSEVSVQLQGDRIKPEHAYLYCTSDQWHIVAVQGEVRIAGKSISESTLSLSKPFSIGPYLLKLELQQEHDKVDQSTNVKKKKTKQKDKKTDGDEVTSELNETAADALHEPDSKPVNKLLVFLSQRKKVIIPLTACLLLLMIGVIALLGDDEKPSGVVLIEEESYTVEQKREVDRYSSWVKQLWQEGDTEKAVLVSRTAYVNNPLIEKLKALYVDTVVRHVEGLSSDSQHEKAQAFLLGLEGDVLEHVAVQRLIKALATDIQQKREHRASYQESKQKFDAIISRSEQAYNDGDIEQASSALQSIDPLLIKFEPDWKRQKNVLETKLEEAIQRQEELRDEQRRKRIKKVQFITKQFDKCLAFYRKGDSPRAYFECQHAAKRAEGTKLEDEINIWLKLLSPAYEKEIVDLTAKAEDCYENKWIKCAFTRWQRILKLDPSNVFIQNEYKRALKRQLTIAKQMYQEARAYNDVGRPETAIATLKELQLLYPLPSSDVYVKADKLMDDLSLNSN